MPQQLVSWPTQIKTVRPPRHRGASAASFGREPARRFVLVVLQVVVVVALSLATSSAWAQRVLLIEPSSDDPFLFEAYGRLRAELELEAFEVEVLRQNGIATDIESVEELAHQRDAFAAVLLRRSRSGTTAQVCIVDRVTGKTTLRHLQIESSHDGPTLLAIRAVDLLRVSLSELTQQTRPAAAIVDVRKQPPPAAVTAFVARPKRFRLEAGALVLISPSVGVGYGMTLGFSVRPVRALSLGVRLAGPFLGGEFSAESGTAKLRQEFAVAEFGYVWSSASLGQRWEVEPLLGLGAAHLVASAEVQAPLVGQSEQMWGFAASLGCKLRHHFNDTLSLGLQADAFAIMPRPVIALGADTSQPLTVQATVALQLGVAF